MTKPTKINSKQVNLKQTTKYFKRITLHEILQRLFVTRCKGRKFTIIV